MFLDEAIASRHSVRKFANTPIASELLWQILDAGHLAPSAKNSQPWKFVVLNNDQKSSTAQIMRNSREGLQRIGTVESSAKILDKAPAAIAVCATQKSSLNISTYLSLGACLENICLKATDLGVGSLIICDIQCATKQIADMLELTDELVAIVAFGYEIGESRYREKLPLKSLVTGLDEVQINATDDLPEAFIGDEPFIFISYSHKDVNVVLADLVQLKHCGVRLWYDRSILNGEEWDKKALSIIDLPNCVGLFVYISENSAKSKNVCMELEYANAKFGGGHSIVGIHIGDRPLSSYLGADGECDRILQKVYSDKNKYIPRSSTVGDMGNICDIISQAEIWGAVSESGIYDDFRYVIHDGGVVITQYRGTSKSVTVPTSIVGRNVVAIGPNAFKYNQSVQKLFLPQTVKRVEDGAFFGMSNLQKIFLPDSIEYLGVAVFRKCSSLRRIRLPKYLKTLEEALFKECSSLVECRVPRGVEKLGEAVFSDCTSLIRVILPKTVKQMTEGGFFGCCNLRELTIPPDIIGLNQQSFETCPYVNVDASGFRFRNGKAIN